MVKTGAKNAHVFFFFCKNLTNSSKRDRMLFDIEVIQNGKKKKSHYIMSQSSAKVFDLYIFYILPLNIYTVRAFVRDIHQVLECIPYVSTVYKCA